MIRIDVLLPYGLMAIVLLIYFTGNFSQKNKHQGLLFALVASWIYYKGLHYRFSDKVLFPPLKDYFNKNDDKK
jgi:hypothetical protein